MPSSTENSRISSIPSQKFGTDRPHSAAIVIAVIDRRPGLTAARTPAGMPIASATSSASPASSAVTGSFSAIRSRTGRWMRIDWPRSPRSTPSSHSA